MNTIAFLFRHPRFYLLRLCFFFSSILYDENDDFRAIIYELLSDIWPDEHCPPTKSMCLFLPVKV